MDEKECSSPEIAIKGCFLGPKAENREWLNIILNEIFNRWYRWREKQFPLDGEVISQKDKKVAEFTHQRALMSTAVSSILDRFENEIPKFSPHYIGHMFSEISLPALFGHIITLLHNPNNISSEASKVGTQIEKETIQDLSSLMGFAHGVGHFTSGGTIANFEFLFRAREKLRYKNGIKPVLIVSASKHYSWPKAMHLLGLGEENILYIELDEKGRASPLSLKRILMEQIAKQRPILGVVAIAGTTEMGTIDPIHEFVDVIEDIFQLHGIKIWFHVDAAYGGFFRTLINSKESLFSDQARSALASIRYADSITLDPHKLGYVPYSSGVFLCREESDYFQKSFFGPYVESDKNELGAFTLEGSRSAAGAVATYLAFQSLGPMQSYSIVLAKTLIAKKVFAENLSQLPVKIFFPEGLDTNIICFSIVYGSRLSEQNRLNSLIYESFMRDQNYWISHTSLSVLSYKKLMNQFCQDNQMLQDCEEMYMLRLTLMNPFLTSKESRVNHSQQFCKLLLKYYRQVSL